MLFVGVRRLRRKGRSAAAGGGRVRILRHDESRSHQRILPIDRRPLHISEGHRVEHKPRSGRINEFSTP